MPVVVPPVRLPFRHEFLALRRRQHLGRVGERRKYARWLMPSTVSILRWRSSSSSFRSTVSFENAAIKILPNLALEIADFLQVGDRGLHDGMHFVALIVAGLDLVEHAVDLLLHEPVELAVASFGEARRAPGRAGDDRDQKAGDAHDDPSGTRPAAGGLLGGIVVGAVVVAHGFAFR